MPLQALPDFCNTSISGDAPESGRHPGPLQISLLITTFERPQALNLVLLSVERQRRLPDEVIVADDGSGPDTASLVASWARRLPIPVHHVWQENKGFRAGRSRNRGIAAARGEYIVLIDGDMVLDERFIEDHANARLPRRFVQGLRILTNASRTEKMLAHDTTSVGPLTPGLRRPHLAVRSPWLSRKLSRTNVSMGSLKSCNQGIWRADLVAVNGFNEDIRGWGPEDKECCARLMHAGVQAYQLRFSALATHLYHPTRAPGARTPNDEILDNTIARRSTWCECGLDQHLAEFAAGIPASARPPWST
jgi:glycosyltransferase involved in cell wall biosynthesis